MFKCRNDYSQIVYLIVNGYFINPDITDNKLMTMMKVNYTLFNNYKNLCIINRLIVVSDVVMITDRGKNFLNHYCNIKILLGEEDDL